MEARFTYTATAAVGKITKFLAIDNVLLIVIVDYNVAVMILVSVLSSPLYFFFVPVGGPGRPFGRKPDLVPMLRRVVRVVEAARGSVCRHYSLFAFVRLLQGIQILQLFVLFTTFILVGSADAKW